MTFAIEFDFDAKREGEIDPALAAQSTLAARSVWLDLQGESAEVVREHLARLGIDEPTLALLFDETERPPFNVFPGCLHFTLREGRFVDGGFVTVAVDVVLGKGFLATIHDRPTQFLEQVRRTYKGDFFDHARTLGFLLFELADHLTHGYRTTLSSVTERVEATEAQLFGDPGDAIFRDVADLIRDLLDFRKLIVSSREIFHELATRRSPYISESTQPFLEKKGKLLERLSADAATEREVLSESLTLYMGIVSHRTNKVVTRLTVISMIFLPL
ncbi:MAG: hypothetical protein KY476_12535, partial [Planctomycetes bacterium]|nr:hypothetical protein [Planctomycetota bacterium]